MNHDIWLFITSVLLTLVGALFSLGYKDISRRMINLEKQDAKLFAAIMILLIAKGEDHQAIASALHELISNGVKIK